MGNFFASNPSSSLESGRFGYFPDTYDHNDKVFIPKSNTDCKKYTSLQDKFPTKVHNQHGIQCSTAIAVASVVEYCQKKHDLTPNVIPSILYLYYLGRYPHQTQLNTGCSLKQVFKHMNKYGIASEKEYPFIPQHYDKPLKLVTKGHERRYYQGLFIYKKVPRDINNFKICLSVNELPILFGFAVYESFDNILLWDNDMRMPIPKKSEKLIGFQTAVCVGYSNKKQSFLIRNSWGNEFKNNGYFFMPYEYFCGPNCNDFWTLDIFTDLELPVDIPLPTPAPPPPPPPLQPSAKKKKKVKKKRKKEKEPMEFVDEIKEISLNLPSSQRRGAGNFLIQSD